MYEVFGAGAPWLTVLLIIILNYQVIDNQRQMNRVGHAYCEV